MVFLNIEGDHLYTINENRKMARSAINKKGKAFISALPFMSLS
jgi:hypothetical protein